MEKYLFKPEVTRIKKHFDVIREDAIEVIKAAEIAFVGTVSELKSRLEIPDNRPASFIHSELPYEMSDDEIYRERGIIG